MLQEKFESTKKLPSISQGTLMKKTLFISAIALAAILTAAALISKSKTDAAVEKHVPAQHEVLDHPTCGCGY
jgi:hypothetical protein